MRGLVDAVIAIVKVTIIVVIIAQHILLRWRWRVLHSRKRTLEATFFEPPTTATRTFPTI